METEDYEELNKSLPEEERKEDKITYGGWEKIGGKEEIKEIEDITKLFPKPQPLIPKNLIAIATIVMLLFLINLILLAIWLIKGIL